MRYYPPFRAVIPHFGAGPLRVTQPSATSDSSKPESPVRLACLMHAASVYPEPGSNSPKEKHSLATVTRFRGSDRSHIRHRFPVTLQLLRCSFRGTPATGAEPRILGPDTDGVKLDDPLGPGFRTDGLAPPGEAARGGILASASAGVKRPPWAL